ncbi:MAG: hypothetical protein ABIJ46_03525 [bacterium]
MSGEKMKAAIRRTIELFGTDQKLAASLNRLLDKHFRKSLRGQEEKTQFGYGDDPNENLGLPEEELWKLLSAEQAAQLRADMGLPDPATAA